MAFTTITPPAVGDPTKKTAFADAVINNLTDLNSRIGTGGASSGIPNSSFEDDGDADGDPDSWTVTNIGGTSGIIATSGDQAHGLNAWKVDYPASAAQGATIQTNDYIAISPDEIIYLAWKMKGTSSTGAKHIVTLLWYTFDKTALTPTIIYSDTANPTAWTQCLSGAISPSTAKFMKIKIQGSDTTVPSETGSISFDDVRLVNGPADVFDGSALFTKENASPGRVFYTTSSKCIWIEAWGGGGEGRASTANLGGGGGGGEYAAGYFQTTASTLYVIALGGPQVNTTFNSTTVVANAGSSSFGAPGGLGGTGGTGNVKLNGQNGRDDPDGSGGYSPFGGGGMKGNQLPVSGGYTAQSPGGGAGSRSLVGDKNIGGSGQVRVWF